MYFNTTAKSAVDTAPRLAHHVDEQPRATAEEQAPPAAASTSCVASKYDICVALVCIVVLTTRIEFDATSDIPVAMVPMAAERSSL